MVKNAIFIFHILELGTIPILIYTHVCTHTLNTLQPELKRLHEVSQFHFYCKPFSFVIYV